MIPGCNLFVWGVVVALAAAILFSLIVTIYFERRPRIVQSWDALIHLKAGSQAIVHVINASTNKGVLYLCLPKDAPFMSSDPARNEYLNNTYFNGKSTSDSLPDFEAAEDATGIKHVGSLIEVYSAPINPEYNYKQEYMFGARLLNLYLNSIDPLKNGSGTAKTINCALSGSYACVKAGLSAVGDIDGLQRSKRTEAIFGFKMLSEEEFPDSSGTVSVQKEKIEFFDLLVDSDDLDSNGVPIQSLGDDPCGNFRPNCFYRWVADYVGMAPDSGPQFMDKCDANAKDPTYFDSSDSGTPLCAVTVYKIPIKFDIAHPILSGLGESGSGLIVFGLGKADSDSICGVTNQSTTLYIDGIHLKKAFKKAAKTVEKSVTKTVDKVVKSVDNTVNKIGREVNKDYEAVVNAIDGVNWDEFEDKWNQFVYEMQAMESFLICDALVNPTCAALHLALTIAWGMTIDKVRTIGEAIFCVTYVTSTGTAMCAQAGVASGGTLFWLCELAYNTCIVGTCVKYVNEAIDWAYDEVYRRNDECVDGDPNSCNYDELLQALKPEVINFIVNGFKSEIMKLVGCAEAGGPTFCVDGYTC